MDVAVLGVLKRRSIAILTVTLAAMALMTAIARSDGAGRQAVASHRAKIAKTLPLSAKANLHVIKRGTTLSEANGKMTGTLSGTLSVHIIVASAERMTASFVATSHAGRLSGKGSAIFRLSGNTLYFAGIAHVTSGSGALAHASGELQIEGSMNRTRATLSLTISGYVHA